MSQITDSLAFENDLCRRTTSVTRDSKRGQLIVVEEIRKYSSTDDDCYRSEVYYHFADDVETQGVNAIIDMAKEIATFKFMGMAIDSTPVKLAVVTDITAPAPQTEEDAKVLAKKAKAKVAATKRAAKKAAPVEQPVETPVQEPEALYEAPAEPVTAAINPIMFDKAEREHRSYLSPIIQAALGKEWKKDENNMAKVSELIGTLQGKIAVCDSTGAQLESFSETVTQFLTL